MAPLTLADAFTAWQFAPVASRPTTHTSLASTRRKGAHEADATGPGRPAGPAHPAGPGRRPEEVARRGDGHQALADRRGNAAVAGRRAGRLAPAQADPHRGHGGRPRVDD